MLCEEILHKDIFLRSTFIIFSYLFILHPYNQDLILPYTRPTSLPFELYFKCLDTRSMRLVRLGPAQQHEPNNLEALWPKSGMYIDKFCLGPKLIKYEQE